jgi:hypothetical protein
MKKVLAYLPVVLSLGALEWVRTLYELAQVRAALGQPFQSPALKKIYRLDGH